ncbi:MAG: hypothetical protein IAE80_18350 [Anaerolinea sp.]|nr:hypothetical protein [Anaerolinea sp.]
MPKKPTPSPAPWQDLEQQAYHAYREWPIWLLLRERELAERLGKRPPAVKSKPAEGETK